MFNSARHAYEQAARTAVSNRELEASALFKCARMLEACQKAWDEPGRPAELEKALRQNMRLWTLFQAELASPDNTMPTDIRVNLLKISRFIDQRTFEIMAEPRPEKLQALIDIDRNIGSGLSTPVP